MSELLGALGNAWLRLLLYPGGLSAMLAAFILMRLRGVRHLKRPTSAGLLDLLPPLCVITLLPLAPAAPFPYGLDLLTAMLLLLWPALRRAATERAEPQSLAAQYIPMALAALNLASAANTLELSGLLRWPPEPARQVAFVLGAGAWIAAVPRLVPPHPELASACSALGLLLIGTLPLIAGISVIAAATPAWLVVAAAMALATAGIVGFQRLPAQWTYLWAGAALIAAGGVMIAPR
ncbi:hypothetical protein [Chloroflexus sp.]|uniref:hypothetical protein n=1 Tax=Chloroflexus sp. TaxID=1904827 RepID=UPI00298F2B07|nr:hypothetical protein [Chloroflexus sp.]MCS6887657.1 hypothetical protein [Chloroflexus sp.]MDW8403312.1 hypothetical protein [Chloroflexus sp.]